MPDRDEDYGTNQKSYSNLVVIESILLLSSSHRFILDDSSVHCDPLVVPPSSYSILRSICRGTHLREGRDDGRSRRDSLARLNEREITVGEKSAFTSVLAPLPSMAVLAVHRETSDDLDALDAPRLLYGVHWHALQ